MSIVQRSYLPCNGFTAHEQCKPRLTLRTPACPHPWQLQVLVPVSAADETAAPSPAPTGACPYTVKQNDTLFEIAKARHVAVLCSVVGWLYSAHHTWAGTLRGGLGRREATRPSPGGARRRCHLGAGCLLTNAVPNTRQPQDLPCCPPCVQAEGTTLEALQKLNPDVKNPDLIQPGQFCSFLRWLVVRFLP